MAAVRIEGNDELAAALQFHQSVPCDGIDATALPVETFHHPNMLRFQQSPQPPGEYVVGGDNALMLQKFKQLRSAYEFRIPHLKQQRDIVSGGDDRAALGEAHRPRSSLNGAPTFTSSAHLPRTWN